VGLPFFDQPLREYAANARSTELDLIPTNEEKIPPAHDANVGPRYEKWRVARSKQDVHLQIQALGRNPEVEDPSMADQA